MNPYQPLSDPPNPRERGMHPEPACWIGFCMCSGACNILAGLCFLFLPIATVGVLLLIVEQGRAPERTLDVCMVTLVVPICLTIGGFQSARASIRWKTGNPIAALVDSLFAIGITTLPWWLAVSAHLS